MRDETDLILGQKPLHSFFSPGSYEEHLKNDKNS